MWAELALCAVAMKAAEGESLLGPRCQVHAGRAQAGGAQVGGAQVGRATAARAPERRGCVAAC
jgi:hypothetical protein